MGSTMLFSIILGSSALGAAGPSRAPPEEQVTVTGKQDKTQKVVCRRSVDTGSVIPKQVCRSAADWEAQTQRALVLKENMIQQSDAEEHVREVREGTK
jgi:hypothetical protein